MKSVLKSFFLVSFLLNIFTISVQAQESDISVQYETHVQDKGWIGYFYNGEVGGTSGQSLRLESLKVQVTSPIDDVHIKYQGHVQDIGWMNWVKDGEIAGTTGKGLRVEALRLQLENAPGYHVEYKVHVQDIGWMDWVKDGEIAGTTGKALRIEALQIKIVKDAEPTITYQTFMQNKGWLQETSDNQVNGLLNQGLNMEGLKINLTNPYPNMKIKAQLHIQDIGWTNSEYTDNVLGFPGSNKRIEGIRLDIEGAPENYHIIYRAYIQGEGWQGYVKEGQLSGTISKGLKIEALQISLVKTDNINSLIKPKIAIDIGHNARYNTGAVGLVFEDDLTKDVGTRVINKLRNLGYTVVTVHPVNPTSQTDSLSQRVKYANDNESDKFISIHFNKYNGSANGTEVYYYRNDGSINMANNVLNNIVNLGFNNRKVKFGDFHVLRNTQMPAILVEGCFIDSYTDMNLYNPETMSDAIVNGIISSY